MHAPDTTEADDLLARGIAASAAKDRRRAIECFDKACTRAPFSGLPRFLLGAEYAALGEQDRAETLYASALLLAPGMAIARYHLGLLQYQSGRSAMALVTWAPLLQLPRSDPLPHFVLGFAALAQQRFAEAVSHCRAAVQRSEGEHPELADDIRQIIERIH